MLKELPPIARFTRRKDIYNGKAYIGENGGNDWWTANVKVWRLPHERTWSYSYNSASFLTPKNGIAYDPQQGEGHGYEKMVDAYKALKEELEKVFA